MLDDGEVRSLSEIAGKEGLTRARVTQIMNLLKLPVNVREFSVGLDDPKEIRGYSERRLRQSLRPLRERLASRESWQDIVRRG